MSADISAKAKKMAFDFACKIAGRAINAARYKQATSWEQLEKYIATAIPDQFKAMPYSTAAVEAFAGYWKASATVRIETDLAAKQAAAESKPKMTVAKVVKSYGTVTLLPEQQAVVDDIWNKIFVNKTHRAIYQDGSTGSGKTYVAAAIVAECIKHGLHKTPDMPVELPFRYYILTRKNVIESYKRVFEEFGLGKYLGTLIVITSYSAATSGAGQHMYTEVYDPQKEEYVYKINEVFKPFLLIPDEAHALNNPKTAQSKLILAFTTLAHPPYQIWFSATPWVTVNNSRQFVISAGVTFNGSAVTAETFPAFAGAIAKEPQFPNIEAAKRLRTTLSDYICSFPKVKWPHKAINQVLIIDFETDADRRLYDRAYEIYQERKRKAGLNTSYGGLEKLVALNQFRYAVEPYHNPAICDRILTVLKDGKAALCGMAFREPIALLTHRLIRNGLKRAQISIIWGGKRAWRDELLLSDSQMQDIADRVIRGQGVSKKELAAFKETLNYRTERVMRNENAAQQAERLQQMEEMGLLGSQSAAARQHEIDKFQSGESVVCLFTLAAGGVGLSLDHNKPNLLPREGFFTPTYNGPESRQALGRALRRTTLSDVYQWICFMKDTVEEYHVAPLFDTKLKCIANITQDSFVVDLDTAPRVHHKYRTKEEALADASKEEAQLTDTGESDDDEDDEQD